MSWTALEYLDLIPADNADSCHSSADEPKAVSDEEAAISCPPPWRYGSAFEDSPSFS